MLQIRCKYECGFEGVAPVYVGFFKQEKITKLFEKDPYLPKFGFHLGVDCPKCGRHQQWLKQDEETMMLKKFFQIQAPQADNVFEARSANILQIKVSTNCPMGGDGGHGGKTEIEFTDMGGTEMQIEQYREGKFKLIFKGDTECETLIECLEFAARELRRQVKNNRHIV